VVLLASSTQTPSGITIPQWAVYIALAALLVGSVVASYWLKIFPDAFGQVGGGAAIMAVFAFASHQFEQEGTPAGFPRWTSFVVVSVAAIGEGAIGSFTGATLLTVGAFVTWIALVLGLLYHDIASDGGTNFSLNAETWATALAGVAASLAVWWLDNPMAGLAAFVAAFVSIFGMYFHVAGTTVTPVPTGGQPVPPAPIN
jgi:hypothetical protein